LRRYGRSYTRESLAPGRAVELRRGYSGESLWGVIGDVFVASTLEEVLDHIDFREIVPPAKTRDEARRMVERIFHTNGDYVAFRLKDLTQKDGSKLDLGPTG